MENPNTPPKQERGNKRARSESPSPRTPSPNRQEGTPQAPGAPKRPRRRLLNQPDTSVAIDLNSYFDKEAHQQEKEARQKKEADKFLADQTGTAQQVPGSPFVSDEEDD